MGIQLTLCMLIHISMRCCSSKSRSLVEMTDQCLFVRTNLPAKFCYSRDPYLWHLVLYYMHVACSKHVTRGRLPPFPLPPAVHTYPKHELLGRMDSIFWKLGLQCTERVGSVYLEGSRKQWTLGGNINCCVMQEPWAVNQVHSRGCCQCCDLVQGYPLMLQSACLIQIASLL